MFVVPNLQEDTAETTMLLYTLLQLKMVSLVPTFSYVLNKHIFFISMGVVN